MSMNTDPGRTRSPDTFVRSAALLSYPDEEALKVRCLVGVDELLGADHDATSATPAASVVHASEKADEPTRTRSRR